MVNLLRLFQGGMSGIGPLPDGGGPLDQPVIMMDALSLMSSFDAKLQDEQTGPLLNEDDTIDQQAQMDAEQRAMASWLRGGG